MVLIYVYRYARKLPSANYPPFSVTRLPNQNGLSKVNYRKNQVSPSQASFKAIPVSLFQNMRHKSFLLAFTAVLYALRSNCNIVKQTPKNNKIIKRGESIEQENNDIKVTNKAIYMVKLQLSTQIGQKLRFTCYRSRVTTSIYIRGR